MGFHLKPETPFRPYKFFLSLTFEGREKTKCVTETALLEHDKIPLVKCLILTEQGSLQEKSHALRLQ